MIWQHTIPIRPFDGIDLGQVLSITVIGIVWRLNRALGRDSEFGLGTSTRACLEHFHALVCSRDRKVRVFVAIHGLRTHPIAVGITWWDGRSAIFGRKPPQVPRKDEDCQERRGYPDGRILVLSVSDSEFWCDASCLLE